MNAAMLAEDFRRAIADAGLEPPPVIEPGRFHRFPGADKRRGNRAGWCLLFPDCEGGVFGDWSSGLSETWQARERRSMTETEYQAFRERVQAARKEADKLRQQAHEAAAEEARRRWEAAKPADPGHPYLRRKGVGVHGLRQEGSCLLVPVRGITGEWQSLQTIGPDGGKRFLPGGRMGGGTYWLGKRRDGAPVLLAEGFATAASLHEATGHPVVVCFNAGNLLPVAKDLQKKLPEAELIICADNDHGTRGNPGLKKGREAARAVGAALCWPKNIEGTDFNDAASECGREAVKAAVESAQPVEDSRLVVSRCLADVRPEPVRWLWPGRIARGKVTVIAGHPGLGKSQLTASLAAIVTTGGTWPVDLVRAEAGSVVFLTAEDDAADTLRPRLDAAGAEVRRCYVLDAVLDEEGRPRGFDLGRDLDHLERLLKRLGDVVLVVIDPITAYLGRVDSHRNSDIRALLAPLSELAARHRVAIVAVSHLNKAGGTDALLRVSGSLAFTAAARAAWLVAKDPQDEGRRLFLPMKNNLGPDAAGLAFRAEGATLEGGIATSRIVWEAEPVAIDANAALMPPVDDEARTEREEAAEWLLDELRDGPVAVKELQTRARAAGHAWPTVKRAKSALGIKARKGAFSAGWRWYPPGPVEGDQHEGDHPLPQDGDPLRWNPHKYYTSGPSDPLGNAEEDHLSGSDPLRGSDPLGGEAAPHTPGEVEVTL